MKVNKKYIIGGVILIVIIFIIVKVVRAKKLNSTPIASTTTSTASVTSTGTSSAGTCSNSTILKRGTKCDRVQWAQYKINKVSSKLGIAKLVDDGIFGSKTEAAFQKLLGKKSGSWNEVQAKVDSII